MEKTKENEEKLLAIKASILNRMPDHSLTETETRILHDIYSMYKKDKAFRSVVQMFFHIFGKSIILFQEKELIKDILLLDNKYTVTNDIKKNVVNVVIEEMLKKKS